MLSRARAPVPLRYKRVNPPMIDQLLLLKAVPLPVPLQRISVGPVMLVGGVDYGGAGTGLQKVRHYFCGPRFLRRPRSRRATFHREPR